MERKKLELSLNQQCSLQLLTDKPHIGNSQYGEYYLYTVLNGDGSTEYSYFAPADVHEQLKELKKGTKFNITKYAEQVGKKVVTKHNIQVVTKPEPEKSSSNDTVQTGDDYYFAIMQTSFQDALKISEKLNGMVDVSKIAVCLFIARSKTNGNGG